MEGNSGMNLKEVGARNSDNRDRSVKSEQQDDVREQNRAKRKDERIYFEKNTLYCFKLL
jgi:hypothetical protein